MNSSLFSSVPPRSVICFLTFDNVVVRFRFFWCGFSPFFALRRLAAVLRSPLQCHFSLPSLLSARFVCVRASACVYESFLSMLSPLSAEFIRVGRPVLCACVYLLSASQCLIDYRRKAKCSKVLYTLTRNRLCVRVCARAHSHSA